MAEVYEMMGHHARVTFSTLLRRGKEDNDNDAANAVDVAVDVADNAVDVDGTIDVADIVLDVVAVPAAMDEAGMQI